MAPKATDEWDQELESPIPFNKYLLLHRLGRGGMGEVYLAKLTGLPGINKVCVVKTLRANVAEDREYVSRFIDEARVVVQLTHRNICSVFDVGQHKAQYYLAMDYIAGHNLRDLLKTRGGPLAEGMTIFILTEMLEALDYAHRLKDPGSGEKLHIVHRDVSPQNVMTTPEGEVKLIDFGLATSTRKSLHTQPNVVMGKMAYMSPEQARGLDVDPRTDLYAAAIIGVELLTGARFYDGLSVDEIWRTSGQGGFKPAGWALLPAGLRKVLDRALAPELNKRFANCAEFREALLDYAHNAGVRSDNRALRGLMDELYGDEVDVARDVLSRFSSPSIESFLSRMDSEEDDESRSFAISEEMQSASHQVSNPEKTVLHSLESTDTTEGGEALEADDSTQIASIHDIDAPTELASGEANVATQVVGRGKPDTEDAEEPEEEEPEEEEHTAPTVVRPRPDSVAQARQQTVVVRDRSLIPPPEPAAKRSSVGVGALLVAFLVVAAAAITVWQAGRLGLFAPDPVPITNPVVVEPVPVEPDPVEPDPVEPPPVQPLVDAGETQPSSVEPPPVEVAKPPVERPKPRPKPRRTRAALAPFTGTSPIQALSYLSANCRQRERCARVYLKKVKDKTLNVSPSLMGELKDCVRRCRRTRH